MRLLNTIKCIQMIMLLLNSTFDHLFKNSNYIHVNIKFSFKLEKILSVSRLQHAGFQHNFMLLLDLRMYSWDNMLELEFAFIKYCMMHEHLYQILYNCKLHRRILFMIWYLLLYNNSYDGIIRILKKKSEKYPRLSEPNLKFFIKVAGW